MKIWICRESLLEDASLKFDENPSSRSPVVTCKQTDGLEQARSRDAQRRRYKEKDCLFLKIISVLYSYTHNASGTEILRKFELTYCIPSTFIATFMFILCNE
jgi:hypothetical protein